MDAKTQIRDGARFLIGLEDGNLDQHELFNLADELDPVILALSVQYLRQKYSQRPESSGIIARLAGFTSHYPDMVSKIKDGEKDPITEWFHETYNFHEYYNDPDAFMTLIVDKLEG